ncbi:ABC transporter permease [Gottschalkia acidurici]|nr:ABC transporter permease [Gottschalkia acidurici]
MFLFFSFISLVIINLFREGLPNFFANVYDEEILFAIRLSLVTSTISTLICMAFALPISYALARYEFPFKSLVMSIMQIPMSLPPLASGLALLLFFSLDNIRNFLDKYDISPVFSVKGIIVAHFFINTPYMIRILKATIENIDPKLEFVSRTLGYSKLKTFFKITLPLSKKGLFASTVITWSKAMGEFGTVLLLAGATRMKTETLPVTIYLNVSVGSLDKALTSAIVLIVISSISLLIFSRFEDSKF